MKNSLLIFVLTALMTGISCAATNPINVNDTNQTPPAADSKPLTLNNETDRISYSLGYDIGHSFQSQKVQLNIDAINEGVKNGFMNQKSLLSNKEMQQTLMNFQKQLIMQRQAQLAKIGEKNLNDGKAFLANNKTKPGVVTLANGLQYKIIDVGTGKSPTAKDIVTVNYQGSFINGQVFDSTYMSNGKPLTVPVARVIPGWKQVLTMMKAGATWEVYIPADLAYGNHAVGPIGPNQTLIFKIALLAVNPTTLTNQAIANNSMSQNSHHH